MELLIQDDLEKTAVQLEWWILSHF